METPTPLDLSRRERQIMEAVYARGQASVTEVLDGLPDPPSYSAVRAILNMLTAKGHLRRKKEGKKFLYVPTAPRDKVRRSALRRLLATFFEGSATQAMASLLDEESLNEEELEGLARLIEKNRKARR